MNSAITRRATVRRLASLTPIVKSRASMEPEVSRASMMSMPSLSTTVSRFVS